MKKISKLEINSEKLMKNNELITLRGGYDGCHCDCYNWEMEFLGQIDSDVLSCNPDCIGEYGHGFGHWHCE